MSYFIGMAWGTSKRPQAKPLKDGQAKPANQNTDNPKHQDASKRN